MVSPVCSVHCSHLFICTRAYFHPSSGFTSAVGSLSLWSVNCRGSSRCCNSGDDLEKLNIPWSWTAFFIFHFLLIYLLFFSGIIFLSFLFFGMYLVFHWFVPQLVLLSVSVDNYSSVPGIAEHLLLLCAVHRRAVLQHSTSVLFPPKAWVTPVVSAGLLRQGLASCMQRILPAATMQLFVDWVILMGLLNRWCTLAESTNQFQSFKLGSRLMTLLK